MFDEKQRPLLFETRRTSCSEALGSGIEQRTSDTGTRALAIRSLARPSSSGDGSTVHPINRSAIQRQVHPRADPDVKHSTTRRSDRGLPITSKSAVPHRQFDHSG
jgi:hypothetical protein